MLMYSKVLIHACMFTDSLVFDETCFTMGKVFVPHDDKVPPEYMSKPIDVS